MRILVTGATGLIGRRLCTVLTHVGHEVVALVRDPSRALRDQPGLVAACRWDAMSSPPPEAFDDVDGIVNLAGEPVRGRWSASKKQQIRDTRVLGTRQLIGEVEGREKRPTVIVSASAIGYYGDRADETLTETSGPGTGFLAGVCTEWETAAARAEGFGMRCVRLRIGVVLGRDGGALTEMIPMFTWGLGGRLGSGRQWWSWIHIEDLVQLILFALTAEPVAGPLNATAPEPVRQAAFAKTIATQMRRPALMWTPATVLRLALGGFASELLTSRRVVPSAAMEAGFIFRFGSLESALDDLQPV